MPYMLFKKSLSDERLIYKPLTCECSASARRLEDDGFEYHIDKDIKCCTHCCYIRCVTLSFLHVIIKIIININLQNIICLSINQG